MDIPIRGENIDLDQFLKLSGAAQTGGHAKFLVQEGAVRVNGEVETRRRKTLTPGDVVTVEEQEFRVAKSA